MSRLVYYILTIAIGLSSFSYSYSQEQSVARIWNEVILEAIRNDFARPTVHARNLFHLSAGMYDAWAVFDDKSETYFLNKTNHGYNISYQKTYFLFLFCCLKEKQLPNRIYFVSELNLYPKDLN